MRTPILSVLILFFVSTFSFAQKMRDVNPNIMPKRVVEKFRERHPDAFIKNWKNSMMFPAHFVVNYDDKKEPFRERYRMDGLLLGKSKIYNMEKVPGKWLSRAKSDHPNRTVVSAVRVIDMHEPSDKKTYWFIRLQSGSSVETAVYSDGGVKMDKEKIGFIRDEIELKDS